MKNALESCDFTFKTEVQGEKRNLNLKLNLKSNLKWQIQVFSNIFYLRMLRTSNFLTFY